MKDEENKSHNVIWVAINTFPKEIFSSIYLPIEFFLYILYFDSLNFTQNNFWYLSFWSKVQKIRNFLFAAFLNLKYGWVGVIFTFWKQKLHTYKLELVSKPLGGHFACLCWGFEFYGVKKNLLLFFKKKMEILLHFLSFL